jgi:4-cresol dehydrogenase (hydroxylating)
VIAAGYIPYRSSPGGLARLRVPGDVFWETARQIKSALDPQHVLARGRYIPADEAGDTD